MLHIHYYGHAQDETYNFNHSNVEDPAFLLNSDFVLPSENRLNTQGTAASIDAVESELSCHSHSQGLVPLTKGDF